jgi:hypothetical protein
MLFALARREVFTIRHGLSLPTLFLATKGFAHRHLLWQRTPSLQTRGCKIQQHHRYRHGTLNATRQ